MTIDRQPSFSHDYILVRLMRPGSPEPVVLEETTLRVVARDAYVVSSLLVQPTILNWKMQPGDYLVTERIP